MYARSAFLSYDTILCCVSETKGQDQPEDENVAKARPELEQGETTHVS
jgi:hypothetical protein